MLALTALREKRPEVARVQFSELVAEFPENPLFARELAKLTTGRIRESSIGAVDHCIPPAGNSRKCLPREYRETASTGTL